ncbi:MAG: SusC/RagA family TonB-linked outer membrane protein [Chitinophagaceae bacterium]|nr:MAG: SusC/RagA family TonB-linked outer membrane protein [Chitinophagaceae bacterium]
MIRMCFLRFLMLVLILLGLFCLKGRAQTGAVGVPGVRSDGDPVPLKGKVSLDEFSPSVQILIGSKSVGTITAGSDGSFSFLLKRFPDTVRFRALGYHTVVRVFRRVEEVPKFLPVKMVPAVQELEEVLINTGYQKLKPNEVNGDVSVIDEKKLSARTGTNILDRIIGQTSGLMLNTERNVTTAQGKTNLSVRGLGTINGPLDPLIVLDGFIYEGDINNINPFDIENVSILKDAAAAAIWGARAGNGVIVLTSKKAKLNSAPVVSFNANTTLNALPDLGRLPFMASADYIELEGILFDNGQYNNRISTNLSLTPALEVMLLRRQGRIPAEEAKGKLDVLRSTDVRESYLKDFYTHALLQQYGLNLRGGTDKLAYSIAGAYDRSLGETYGKSSRINLRFSQDYKISDKLTMATSFSLSSNGNRSGRASYGTLTSAARKPSYLSFRDDQGQAVAIAQAYSAFFLDTLGGGRLLNWNFYPADNHNYTFTENKRQEIYGTANLRYRITGSLLLDLGYQFQQQGTENITTNTVESYYARTMINGFSQLNRATGVVTYNVPMGGISAVGEDKVNSSTGRMQLNFDKSFGVHSINAIAGMEARDVETLGSSLIRYGYKADPLQYVDANYVSRFSDFITGNSVQIPPGGNLTNLHYRFISLYANAAYAYKGKYRVTASVRRDGSNIFGANTNDKWKPLVSAGLGWDLSSESFYEISWLPVLRLTGTYGYSGNVDLSKTAAAVGGYGTNQVTGLPMVRISALNNPELKWEQLSQVNVKVDFALRRNLLRGALSFYVKKGSDLYGLSNYDYTGWGAFSQITRNVAKMSGKGLDAEVHFAGLRFGRFRWSSDVYYSFNESKTMEYYYAADRGISAQLGGGTSINPIVGKPLYGIVAYKWGGLDAKGNPQGYLNGELSTNYTAIANEGSTSSNNLVYVGPSSPTHFGSFINTFSLDRFAVSFNLSYRLGYFRQKRSMHYSSFASDGIGHQDYADRWRVPGDELRTNVPSFIYPLNQARDVFYSLSEVNMIRGDNIRLDYVNLSYSVNASTWRFPFRTLDVFANASNVGMLWKANKYNIDPDYVSTVPPSKGFTFGFRGSF